MRVSYREDPAARITVNVIRTWARGEIEAPVLSASSGPKDYLGNHIWAIFDRYPNIASVMMVRGEFVRSAPFLLVSDAAGRFFDMAGIEVVMEA